MALAAHDWLAGTELGDRFRDVRLLHAGTRFTVYEGWEPAANRAVAIKIPDEAAAPWQHGVLEREGTLLARLGGHPHILTYYQSLRLDDGRPALLLERCGHTLYDALHDEPMPLQDAVAIGIKLMKIRDLRPANMLPALLIAPALVALLAWLGRIPH